MPWVLMIATLTHLAVLPGQGPSYEWRAYQTDSLEGCKTALRRVRTPDTWHANCHDNSRSATYALVTEGVDNPNPKAMIDGKEAP